ncbi:MAG: hypothetical protein IJK14_01520 [Clostridia bacterium]|nr:hypothetical protein [Clostridia bacterium]
MTVNDLMASMCCATRVQQSLFDIVDDGPVEFNSENLIEAFIRFCRSQHKLNIIKWNPPSEGYPDYMLLGGDKGILGYILFSCVVSDKAFSECMLNMNSHSVLRVLQKADSHLDRPVFYVYIIVCEDIKGIYFETNEQIKDRWFQTGFTDRVYTPIFLEMGTVSNLFEVMNDLKKHGVRFSKNTGQR